MVPVTNFRPTREGPEADLEKVIVGQLPRLFPVESKHQPVWAARSVPVGAGMPDIVIVSCHPHVVALANVEYRSTEILAYLRAVTCARFATIVERINQSKQKTDRQLMELVDVNAVREKSGVFSLCPTWREILPEIITIEAKVENWRTAINQAARNRIFAHRSYVALPDRIATRIRNEKAFSQLGLGLLRISPDEEIKIIRRGRRHHPRVWLYYYRLAALLAADFHGAGNLLGGEWRTSFPSRKRAKASRNSNL